MKGAFHFRQMTLCCANPSKEATVEIIGVAARVSDGADACQICFRMRPLRLSKSMDPKDRAQTVKA
jgi:hypothetical protein